jgi:hypothetical protein
VRDITIAGLLALGQQIIREREEAEQRQRDQAERERLVAWKEFVQAARRNLGELARDLDPSVPPEDFGTHQNIRMLEVVPFKAARIHVHFFKSDDGWGIVERRTDYRGVQSHSFAVPGNYHLRWDDGGDHGWYLVWQTTDYPETLAEAVALAYQRDDQAAEVLASAETELPPDQV